MKVLQLRRASVLLVAVALAMFGLAACGDDDDDGGDDTTAAETTTEETAGGGGAASTLEVSAPADGTLAFDQSELTAMAGEVTVNFDNPSQIPHDVVIEDQSGNEIGKTDLVTGGSASTSVELEPGTFTFFCDVAGHREAGMEGTLTVN
jgi:plastocyanin